MDIAALILLGVGVGTFGTLIGAGGGFLLVPVLLLLHPESSPETITAISLSVVFLNALSGSIAYARMGRIDYRSGWIFAVVTVPGAILGAWTTNQIPRDAFNLAFGLLMIATSLYLFFSGPRPSTTGADREGRWTIRRRLTEHSGETHQYSYDVRPGILISIAVGYLSSLLGIGGGIIHVPAMNRLLRFPVHIATATSHFVLAIMALAGTAAHIYSGALSQSEAGLALPIGIGAVLGAQGGAVLAKRMSGRWIIQALAAALGFVGIRIALLPLLR